MSTIAELDISTPAMRRTLQQVPEMDVSIVQQTRDTDGSLDVVVDTGCESCTAFECGLDIDPTVADWIQFSESDRHRRYRIRLTDRGGELFTYDCWSREGAVFLDGTRRDDGWRFRIQFPNEEGLQQYVAGCESLSIDFALVRLSRTDGSVEPDRFGLTNTQTQTLLDANQRGYFKVPRQCSLEELAAESDITHQALSERLRRGMDSLVESTLG